MSRLLKTLPIALLAISSMSCAPSTTETAPRTVSDYCLIAKGISFSEIKQGQTESAANAYDTPETVAQVKAHDLKYEAVCPSKTPQ